MSYRLQSHVFQRFRVCHALILALIGTTPGFAQNTVIPGSLDLAFVPGIPSTNRIGALAADADGTALVVAGADLTTGGGPYFRGRTLFRLDGDGSVNARLADVSGPLDQSRWGTTDWASIDALSIQPDGSMFIAGLFVRINGLERHDLARLDRNGGVISSFNPDPGLPVYSPFMPTPAPMINWMLPLQDGRVLVTGVINAMNGQHVPELAVVRADGTLDSTFQYAPSLVGMVENISNQPFPVAQQGDGGIFVAGSPYGGLTGENQVSSNRVVRLSSDGALDSTFTPVTLLFSPVNPGAERFLRPGAVQADGKLLLIGNFSGVNGQPSTNIARINLDGSPDTAFNARVVVDAPVHALALQADGRLLIGGAFEHVNGEVRTHVARLNADGSLDAGFNPGSGANGPILHMALQGSDRLLISGRFEAVNGEPRPGLARLHLGTLAPDVPRIIRQPVDQAVAEGQSARFEVTAASAAPLRYQWLFNGVARPGATNAILDLHVAHRLDSGGYSVVVGNAVGAIVSASAYLSVTRIPASGLGGIDIDFAGPTLATSDPSAITVRRLLSQPDGKVIALGPFQAVDGAPAQQLVRLNHDGTIDPSFSLFHKTNSAPFERFELTAAVLQPDGQLLVGRQNWDSESLIMRLGTDGQPDPSFSVRLTNGGSLAMPSTLALQRDGKVLCGGSFTAVNGMGRTNLARLNNDGSVDNTFVGPAVDWWERVTLVAVQPNGQILAGLSAQPNPRAYPALMRLNVDGALDPSFTTRIAHPEGFEELDVIIVQSDGAILLGGRFGQVSGAARDGMARLTPDGALDPSFTPPAAASFGWGYLRARTAVVQADGRTLWVVERDTHTAQAPQTIIRLNTDGTLDPTFVAATIVNRGSFYPWQITALALTPGGSLMIGGRFTDVGPATRAAVARLYTVAPDVLRLTAPSWTQGGLRVFVPMNYGASYTLESTSDLRSPWQPISKLRGLGGMSPILLPSGAGQGLFRLRAN